MKLTSVLLAVLCQHLQFVLGQPAPISQMLVSQREAAQKAHDQKAASGQDATVQEILDAVDAARQAEIRALRSGRPELVVTDDIPECEKAMRKAGDPPTPEEEKAWDQVITDRIEAEQRAKDAYQEQLQEEVREIQAKREKAEAEAEDKRQAQLKQYRCPVDVRIGTSEKCVFLLLGEPDHLNTDALTGEQLIYPHKYVYINLQGRVSNIQTSY